MLHLPLSHVWYSLLYHNALLSLFLSLYRVQPVAAGCIIGWDTDMSLMQCPPHQCTGTHFADLGRMTG